ncbi:O-acetyl-ADP-ribose deacetylase [Arthrobacter tumbae]|uniref:O-acetyl-ADP-ribose deacetylase n=1 Tax=Arthrobacter tumbae TaxID=163874 RepID=UPI00195DB322|nr:O-acetyl-ADP-ribose deacetylase [Arthrobacter tumbae]MBM7783079.1 O-acetyl-ADP-ribose deacetylase (regulator of RNase III) [Arthrobacter tumbae]
MASEVQIVQGDITTQQVDAVVNAANSSLLGGGGVDGAIHAAAGPELLEACRALRAGSLPDGLPVGQAVATPGFGLPARWIIHTVGPNRHAGQSDPALLESCFRRSLEVADELNARSVALPAISAGIFGWDPEAVARIAFATVADYDGGVRQIRFVLFSALLVEVFRHAHRDSRD